MEFNEKFNELIQDMQTSLSCKICFDVIQNPWKTQCNHLFCKQCLEKTFYGSINVINCPICSTKVSKNFCKPDIKIDKFSKAVWNVIYAIQEDNGINTSRRKLMCENAKDDLVIQNSTDSLKSFTRKTRSQLTSKLNDNKKRKMLHDKVLHMLGDDQEHSIHGSKLSSEKGNGCSKGSDNNLNGVTDSVQENIEKLKIVESGRKSDNNHNAKSNDSKILSPQPMPSPNSVNKSKEKVKMWLEHREYSKPGTSSKVSQCNSVSSAEAYGTLSMKNVSSDDSFGGFVKNKNKVQCNETTRKKVVRGNNKNADLRCKNLEKVKELKSLNTEIQKADKLSFNQTLNDSQSHKVQKPTLNKEQVPGNKKKAAALASQTSSRNRRNNRNIRFASEVKTKLLPPLKPCKLVSSSKAKKSPGWSRVEGAKDDLKSLHTSLNIKGGEQKANASNLSINSSKLEVMALPLSQETDIAIEETNSQSQISDKVKLRSRKFCDIKTRANALSKDGDNIRSRTQKNTFSEIVKNVESVQKKDKNISNVERLKNKADGFEKNDCPTISKGKSTLLGVTKKSATDKRKYEVVQEEISQIEPTPQPKKLLLSKLKRNSTKKQKSLNTPVNESFTKVKNNENTHFMFKQPKPAKTKSDLKEKLINSEKGIVLNQNELSSVDNVQLCDIDISKKKVNTAVNVTKNIVKKIFNTSSPNTSNYEIVKPNVDIPLYENKGFNHLEKTPLINNNNTSTETTSKLDILNKVEEQNRLSNPDSVQHTVEQNLSSLTRNFHYSFNEVACLDKSKDECRHSISCETYAAVQRLFADVDAIKTIFHKQFANEPCHFVVPIPLNKGTEIHLEPEAVKMLSTSTNADPEIGNKMILNSEQVDAINMPATDAELLVVQQNDKAPTDLTSSENENEAMDFEISSSENNKVLLEGFEEKNAALIDKEKPCRKNADLIDKEKPCKKRAALIDKEKPCGKNAALIDKEMPCEKEAALIEKEMPCENLRNLVCDAAETQDLDLVNSFVSENMVENSSEKISSQNSQSNEIMQTEIHCNRFNADCNNGEENELKDIVQKGKDNASKDNFSTQVSALGKCCNAIKSNEPKVNSEIKENLPEANYNKLKENLVEEKGTALFDSYGEIPDLFTGLEDSQSTLPKTEPVSSSNADMLQPIQNSEMGNLKLKKFGNVENSNANNLTDYTTESSIAGLEMKNNSPSQIISSKILQEENFSKTDENKKVPEDTQIATVNLIDLGKDSESPVNVKKLKKRTQSSILDSSSSGDEDSKFSCTRNKRSKIRKNENDFFKGLENYEVSSAKSENNSESFDPMDGFDFQRLDAHIINSCKELDFSRAENNQSIERNKEFKYKADHNNTIMNESFDDDFIPASVEDSPKNSLVEISSMSKKSKTSKSTDFTIFDRASLLKSSLNSSEIENFVSPRKENSHSSSTKDIKTKFNFENSNSLKSTSTFQMSMATKNLFEKCDKDLLKAKNCLEKSDVSDNDENENINKKKIGKITRCKSNFDTQNNSALKNSNAQNRQNDEKNKFSGLKIGEEEATFLESCENKIPEVENLKFLGLDESFSSAVISTPKRRALKNEIQGLSQKLEILENEKPDNFENVLLNQNSNSKVSDKNNLSENSDDADAQKDAEMLLFSYPSSLNEQSQSPSKVNKSTEVQIHENSSQEKNEKKIVLICTGLNQFEVSRVQKFVKFASTLLKNTSPTSSWLSEVENVSLASSWSSEVTHIIVRTDEEGKTERTLKYLMGVANKRWIVSCDWIIECLKRDSLLPEKDFEALDCTGAEGPRISRLTSKKIFENCQFVLVPPFEDLTSEQLTKLVEDSGGLVLSKFDFKSSVQNGLKLVIVGQQDDSDDELDFQICPQVKVGHEWLIECIGMSAWVALSGYVVGDPTHRQLNASGISPKLMTETQYFI